MTNSTKRPLWMLLILPPVIGELLSTSSPPVEFFNPIALITLGILYGGGAILIREITVKWKKGWTCIFLLGAAYGIIEEGLMCKSFFDSHWTDIGLLGVYGRYLGVNWTWTFNLIVFHSVISIAIPIALTELYFPDIRDKSIISKKGIIIIAFLFLLNMVTTFLFITKFRPSAIHIIGAIFVTIILIYIASKMPDKRVYTNNKTIRIKPIIFWLIGFICTLTYFLNMYISPALKLNFFLNTAILAFIISFAYAVLRKLTRNFSAWDERHIFALVAGIISVLVFLDVTAELSKDRTDNPAGMAIVGVITITLLILFWKKIKRRVIAKSAQDIPSEAVN